MAELSDKAQAILSKLQEDYFENENVMGEFLSAVTIEEYDPEHELTFEDAFQIYIEAMNWACGDQFFRRIGEADDDDELEEL